MPIYLGFDSSTQSLSVLAIEVEGPHRRVIFERSMAFDETLPEYGTRHGVVPQADPLVAVSSPLMWADALDRMMGVIARDGGIDLSRVAAISGSAQQHGSVYLASGAGRQLDGLDPARPLASQLDGVLSRDLSPIWMDASTRAECEAITERLGGAGAVARLTGSRAFERFTGPQIRKFFTHDAAAYERTERIHLVSSYLASLLAGCHAPIDPGDGSGMNLMDIREQRWALEALQATAPGLEARLPPILPSWTVVGRLSRYWQQRHGFPAANVVAWSGDNPCSLVGVGLVREGRIAVSLGTSDTVFGFMADARVDDSGTGHVFGSPTGDYMGLTCFRNGSLARERVRADHGLDWEGFSRALRDSPPGNGGAMMLPWFEAEITPPVLHPGVRRRGLDARDARAEVRAVVEGQMLAMARHSRWMGVRVDTIHATGGAARNRDILRVMADVFGADVYQSDVGNSACLGAALRAYHADERSRGRTPPWDEIVAGFADPVVDSRIRPIDENVRLYADLAGRHAAFEAEQVISGPPRTQRSSATGTSPRA